MRKHKQVTVSSTRRKHFASMALAAGLHEGDEGNLEATLKDILSGKTEALTVLVYEDSEPVGCAVALTDGLIMVFVREAYRGQAYGSKMIKRIVEKSGNDREHLYAFHGNDVRRSSKFWARNSIRLPLIFIPTVFKNLQKGAP